MSTSLQFGIDRSIALELPGDALVADKPAAEPVADMAQAIRTAMEEPLEFPSLSQTVLPDDTVALALEPGLSCAPQLVAGTINLLIEVGVPPELITIVRTANDKAITDKRLMAEVDSAIVDRIQIVRHDADDRERLSYLGASRDEKPYYVNRTLCDASVVIPIIAWRNHEAPGCLGVHHSWFPRFGDRETQERFAKTQASTNDRKFEKRRDECVEVAWMLGVQMMVLLVPGGNDCALHVLAGSPNAIWKKGTELAEGAWRVEVPRRASLVVAAIGGGPEQQTWDNVVRTIDTALEAVAVDGTIAVCSQLKTRPGPALQKLAGAADYEAADRAIRKRPTPDSLAASRLNRALQRARVYLLSELPENDVEDLGVAWVANEGEIAKLSSQYDSCLVLQNAQHVSISLVNDDELDSEPAGEVGEEL